jgi:hypothetical protein
MEDGSRRSGGGGGGGVPRLTVSGEDSSVTGESLTRRPSAATMGTGNGGAAARHVRHRSDGSENSQSDVELESQEIDTSEFERAIALRRGGNSSLSDSSGGSDGRGTTTRSSDAFSSNNPSTTSFRQQPGHHLPRTRSGAARTVTFGNDPGGQLQRHASHLSVPNSSFGSNPTSQLSSGSFMHSQGSAFFQPRAALAGAGAVAAGTGGATGSAAATPISPTGGYNAPQRSTSSSSLLFGNPSPRSSLQMDDFNHALAAVVVPVPQLSDQHLMAPPMARTSTMQPMTSADFADL